MNLEDFVSHGQAAQKAVNQVIDNHNHAAMIVEEIIEAVHDYYEAPDLEGIQVDQAHLDKPLRAAIFPIIARIVEAGDKLHDKCPMASNYLRIAWRFALQFSVKDRDAL